MTPDGLMKLQAELRFMGIVIPDLHLRVKYDIHGITSIDFSNIELDLFSHFPVSITRLQNLKQLSLQDNFLRKIPEDIFGIASLEKLDLSNNKISELPETCTNLKNLRELNLKNNNIGRINVLPPNLIRLNLTNNRIDKLPELHKLQSLQFLSIANNNISKIPTNYAESQLNYINLRSNEIEKIPSSMRDENITITKINLYNNPLNMDHPLVFDREIKVLQDHRSPRLGQNSKILRPRTIDLRFERFYPPQFGLAMSAIPFTPVMIYGSEFAGKRLLLKRFIHEKYVADEELSIVQNRYQNWDHYILKKNQRYYQIWYPHNQNLNDPNYRSGIVNGFYYASVFILVFDVTDSSSFDTVLHAIRRISAFRNYHTPIIVVGNKIDLRRAENLTSTDIQRKFIQLESQIGRNLIYYETSAETGENIDAVFDYLFSIYSG